MFDYQSYLINQANVVYQQIRLSVGLMLNAEQQTFLQFNVKCTNLTQMQLVEALILEPLKTEIEQNPVLYHPQIHLFVQQWNQDFQAIKTTLLSFNQTFTDQEWKKNDEPVLLKLLNLNTQKLLATIVSLKVVYQKDFLKIPLPNFLNQLKIADQQNAEQVLTWATLKIIKDLIQTFYQDLALLKKSRQENEPLVYEFIQAAQFWIFSLKLTLIITLQVLLTNHFADWSGALSLNFAYEVLEKFADF
jgi:hypothetical protein